MWVRAVLQALDRAVRQGVVSPHVIRVQTRILARGLPFASNVSPGRKEFRQRYGCDPPWMIVVSPEPEDAPAMEALADEEYYKGLVAYGEELSRLSQPIWEAEYL